MYKHFKVYVGCGLTHAPIEFQNEVEAFKEKLRSIATVMCFLGCGSGATPNQVYQWGIHDCVYKSDLMIAICDFASTGLGYEIATQVEKRQKPLLAMAHDDAKVSDLILDTRQPGFVFRRYESLRYDAFEKAKAFLEIMQREASEGTLFEEQARRLAVA